MSVLRNPNNPLNIFNLGSGMDTSTGKRDINLDKFKPTLPNPEYDVSLPADQQYQLDPGQRVDQWGNKYNVVGENAPGGLGRGLTGLGDFLTFGVWDFDQRGNLFGGEHLPGLAGGSGYGGTPTLMQQRIANPNYDEDYVLRQQLGIQQPGAVPNTNLGKYYGNVALQDAYTGWRDNRLLNTRLAQASGFLKDANKYAMDIDRAQMLAALGTTRGIAQTQKIATDTFAAARDAKSRAVASRALARDAATRGATAGLNRSMFNT